MLILFITADTVWAESLVRGEEEIAIDTMWILPCCRHYLVFFMQAGFTQAKNAGNIIMKNLMDFSVGSLIYWVLGFSIMFGVGNKFVSFNGFFLNGDFSHLGLDILLVAFGYFKLFLLVLLLFIL